MAAAGEAPPFWWRESDWRAWALSPLSAAYGLAAGYRLGSARRAVVAAPVLCVGNFTVGGEGKTPVAIALAREAERAGRKPGYLSRGHGGSLSHPHLVDAGHDSVRLVGDEPLLLARHAPTVVTPDRAAGARRLVEEGCDFIVMDDGFQSARILVDYALLVVDGRRGVGNGHVIPGGPLRARLVDQLRHADGIVRMGAGEGADEVVRMAARAGRPIFEAHLRPRGTRDIEGRRFLAFAGIGNPDKFFETLERAGGVVVDRRSFADHHVYLEEELAELADAAGADGLELVTTAKDMARLTHGTAAPKRYAGDIRVLEVDAVFEPANSARTIVGDTIAAWRERALGQ